MKLSLHDVHLPMRHPFTIALGTTTVQHNLVVKLEHNEKVGYGEGASGHAWRKFTPESMRADLESVREVIEKFPFTTPTALWDHLHPLIGHNPFALCALDEAAHDLWGHMQGAPVWKLWGLDLNHLPPSDYTIGIDPIDKMVAKMKEFDGWPIYKIKLGTERDLEIVKELRRHTDAIFRIDANTACRANHRARARNEGPRGGIFRAATPP